MLDNPKSRSNCRSNSYDSALRQAEYAVSIGGVMGMDTTPMDKVLIGTQLYRLLATPQSLSNPRNESAKILLGVCTLLLEQSGVNKRATSALGLLGAVAIDLRVKH